MSNPVSAAAPRQDYFGSKKHGILEPVYAEYGHHYGPKIKIIVGNNRMAVAKELGIKEIPIIVNIWTPETFDLEGRELVLDADGDTTITADTDDQIDIKIAGALSGSRQNIT